jgi:hypothetical protein
MELFEILLETQYYKESVSIGTLQGNMRNATTRDFVVNYLTVKAAKNANKNSPNQSSLRTLPALGRASGETGANAFAPSAFVLSSARLIVGAGLL